MGGPEHAGSPLAPRTPGPGTLGGFGNESLDTTLGCSWSKRPQAHHEPRRDPSMLVKQDNFKHVRARLLKVTKALIQLQHSYLLHCFLNKWQGCLRAVGQGCAFLSPLLPRESLNLCVCCVFFKSAGEIHMRSLQCLWVRTNLGDNVWWIKVVTILTERCFPTCFKAILYKVTNTKKKKKGV